MSYMDKSNNLVIELRNICYRYGNSDLTALKNVNLQIYQGEKIAFLGANGAGKSTLFKHFNGILRPTSGDVLIHGNLISKRNISQIRQKVGIVFQNPDDQIIAPTVEQDIAFGPTNMGLSEDEINHRVNEALKLMEIEELKDRSPHHLSGGQKKKVAIAGILAMKPEVIVLDEPTAGLDPLSADNIIDVIEKMNRDFNITIILSTHNVELVPMFADRIYVMHHGKIEAEGISDKIFTQKKLLEHVHLKMPKIAQMFDLLQSKGIDTDIKITPQNACDEILRLLNEKKEHLYENNS